ncbi:GspE/PulE family protein [Maricaulis sp.]|uniref:GspE/PulE family protein n=1 Tax=Maricaulis sp. TaxID=1486257 RepID=UPI001B2906A6|nr:type II/IV secretion system protein [Maricaulis sp.]MBO6764127.1 Flp pilus assembly complex ATPase component TadA [Maricaulis sp.]
MDNRRIGEILLEDSHVTAEDVEAAARFQAKVGGLFGQALLRVGALSEDVLLAALSRQLDFPVLDMAVLPEEPSAYRAAADRLGLAPDWLLQHDTVLWFEAKDEQAAESAPSLLGEGRGEGGDTSLRSTGRESRHTPSSVPSGHGLPGEKGEAGADNMLSESADPYAAEQFSPEAEPPQLNVFARAPLHPPVLEALERAWRGPAVMWLGPTRLLDGALASLRSSGRVASADDADDLHRLREMAEEAPVIDLVNGMFEDALRQGASDIHIEPFESHVQIRFRIDGVLRTVNTLPRSRFDAVASRVKLLSGMDIAERRLPQDGRQSVRFAGQDIDLRVSSLPGAWGESIVLRLLRKQQSLPSLEGLGLEGRSMEAFQALLEERNGVILVTGPTGSGKSTTLYRGLEGVNDGQRKIITIEDPVEYDMDGITQVQARADIGYTFARGLRAILRQDPDVIMIGEIRDGETAGIAVQAALTGHLVFSTLHTNTALSAVERLVDLGVEPFLVSASLRGLMGQRLVRRLCGHCSVPAGPAAIAQGEARLDEVRRAGADLPDSVNQPHWREARGCAHCSGTGYSGRVAVFEVARFTNAVRQAINEARPESDLIAAARKDGFLTMYEDGLVKAAQGYTSTEEILRVLGQASAAHA